MFPVGAITSRMRLLTVSLMNRFPELSMDTPVGIPSWAPVAGPPSPLNPSVPFPATVRIVPVAATTSRIRLLLLSAMKMLPKLSTDRSLGLKNVALVAGPPSPPKP